MTAARTNCTLTPSLLKTLSVFGYPDSSRRVARLFVNAASNPLNCDTRTLG